MVAARAKAAQDEQQLLNGLAACSPGTFVATSSSLLARPPEGAEKPPGRNKSGARKQAAQPVTYHLQILKLAQLRLKEQLPGEHLLALTQTAASALDGLQQGKVQLRCKPHDLIIQRYSIVRHLIANRHFQAGLLQSQRMRSELAATLAEPASILHAGANEPLNLVAASSASQEVCSLVLGALFSLLKCTVEVVKPSDLLRELQPLRTDLEGFHAWTRNLPLALRMQHSDSFFKIVQQVASVSAPHAGTKGNSGSIDWLARLVVDACLVTSTPHKLDQVIAKLAEVSPVCNAVVIYRAALTACTGNLSYWPQLLAGLVEDLASSQLSNVMPAAIMQLLEETSCRVRSNVSKATIACHAVAICICQPEFPIADKLVDMLGTTLDSTHQCLQGFGDKSNATGPASNQPRSAPLLVALLGGMTAVRKSIEVWLPELAGTSDSSQCHPRSAVSSSSGDRKTTLECPRILNALAAILESASSVLQILSVLESDHNHNASQPHKKVLTMKHLAHKTAFALVTAAQLRARSFSGAHTEQAAAEAPSRAFSGPASDTTANKTRSASQLPAGGVAAIPDLEPACDANIDPRTCCWSGFQVLWPKCWLDAPLQQEKISELRAASVQQQQQAVPLMSPGHCGQLSTVDMEWVGAAMGKVGMDLFRAKHLSAASAPLLVAAAAQMFAAVSSEHLEDKACYLEACLGTCKCLSTLSNSHGLNHITCKILDQAIFICLRASHLWHEDSALSKLQVASQGNSNPASTRCTCQGLMQGLIHARAQLHCQLTINARARSQQLPSSSSTTQQASSSNSGRRAGSKKTNTANTSSLGFPENVLDSSIQGADPGQHVQIPSRSDSWMVSLLINSDLDLCSPPVTSALVAELCALQQLAFQPRHIELTSSRHPPAGSDGPSPAHDGSRAHQQLAAGNSARKGKGMASAAQASAEALARSLLDDIFPADQHPVQHAQVLAAAAVLDTQPIGLESGVRRLKRAAALLDKALAQDNSHDTCEALLQQAATHAHAALLGAQMLVAEECHTHASLAAKGRDQDANVTAAMAAMSLTGSTAREPVGPASAAAALSGSSAEKAISAWEAAAAATAGQRTSTPVADGNICGLPDIQQLLAGLAHMLGLQGQHELYTRTASLLGPSADETATNALYGSVASELPKDDYLLPILFPSAPATHYDPLASSAAGEPAQIAAAGLSMASAHTICRRSGTLPDPDVWHNIAHALANKGNRHPSRLTQRAVAHQLAASGFLMSGDLVRMFYHSSEALRLIGDVMPCTGKEPLQWHAAGRYLSCLMQHARCCERAGLIEDAFPALREGASLAKRIGADYLTAYFHCLLAEMHHNKGELGRAESYLRQASAFTGCKASPAAAVLFSAMLGYVTALQTKHDLSHEQSVRRLSHAAAQHCQNARQLVSCDPVAFWHLQDLQMACQSLLGAASRRQLDSHPQTSTHNLAPCHRSNQGEPESALASSNAGRRQPKKASKPSLSSTARSSDHAHVLEAQASGCCPDADDSADLAAQPGWDLSVESGNRAKQAASLLWQHSQQGELTWHDLTATADDHPWGTHQMQCPAPRAILWGLRHRPQLQQSLTAPDTCSPPAAYEAKNPPRSRRMQKMSAAGTRPASTETSAANAVLKAAASSATQGGARSKCKVQHAALQALPSINTTTSSSSSSNHATHENPSVGSESGAEAAGCKEIGQQTRFAGLLEAYLLSWSSPRIHREAAMALAVLCGRFGCLNAACMFLHAHKGAVLRNQHACIVNQELMSTSRRAHRPGRQQTRGMQTAHLHKVQERLEACHEALLPQLSSARADEIHKTAESLARDLRLLEDKAKAFMERVMTSLPGNGLLTDHWLIISRLEHGHPPIIMQIPVHDSSALPGCPQSRPECSSAQGPAAMQQLESILSKNEHSMSTSIPVETKQQKQAWWSARIELDEQLTHLLGHVDAHYLGPWRCLLQGPDLQVSNREAASVAAAFVYNTLSITCSPEAASPASSTNPLQALLESLMSASGCMTSREFKAALAQIGLMLGQEPEPDLISNVAGAARKANGLKSSPGVPTLSPQPSPAAMAAEHGHPAETRRPSLMHQSQAMQTSYLPDAETGRSTKAGAEGFAAEPSKGLRRSARTHGSDTPAATPAPISRADAAESIDAGPTPQPSQPAAAHEAGARPAATVRKRPGTSRMASMMKAPTTAAAKPPAASVASASVQAARRNPRQPTANTQKRRQLSSHASPGADAPMSRARSSCKLQTAGSAHDTERSSVKAIGDSAASNCNDDQQAATPSACDSLVDDAEGASPTRSPSPVRQLAFQLEHTALEEGLTPAGRPRYKAEQCRRQQLRLPARKAAASSTDAAAADDLAGGETVAGDARGPVLLVLGDELQAMPWESLPGLRSESIYRAPSLYSAWAAAASTAPTRDAVEEDKAVRASAAAEALPAEQKPIGVDPAFTSYLLNPGNDLAATQQTFQAWLQQQPSWQGDIGQSVSSDGLAAWLQTQQQFLYFGHGAGDQYLPSKQLRRLHSGCACLLAGCSSGHLAPQGSYSSAGPILAYLLAGCPAVVGSLWDVTDRDLDRFCVPEPGAIRLGFVQGQYPDLGEKIG
ncbi:hypothetical protein WJX74_004795 [Apatococcus lobatus]|uniref:separase n=1 Tax=Apatococcus lobatus TaxID=904363 RepID=A0AAW1QUD2_9CHLO